MRASTSSSSPPAARWCATSCSSASTARRRSPASAARPCCNGRQHADTTLVADHAAGGCTAAKCSSRCSTAKAAASSRARSSCGRMRRRPTPRWRRMRCCCRKTAEADNKPELEIFADDVQCGHGATAGALDEDLLFYLKARGIPAKEAEALLIQAFVGEAVEGIEHAGLREVLIEQVARLARDAGAEPMHPAVTNGSYDVDRIREDFPILAMQVYGKPLIYLDNAASAQKPKAVLDRIQHAYTARIRQRASRPALSRQCRDRGLRGRAREGARLPQCRRGRRRSSSPATPPRRSTSSPIPSAASALKEGDEIVLSIMEHHSNIVPWHFLRERQGAVIKWAPVDDDGNFLIDEFEKLLDAAHQDGRDHAYVERARHHRAGQGGGEARACPRHSGAGRRQPGARCISTSTCRTSAATSTSSPATSSTGRPASACSTASMTHLAAMPPFNGGGEMIREVFEDRITYGEPPHKFEAGTPLDRAGDRARRRHRLCRLDRQGAHPRARGPSWSNMPMTGCARSTRCASSAPPRRRARSSPSR